MSDGKQVKMKVDSAAEAYLAVLADRGVDYLFGNAGTDFPSIIEAFAKAAGDSGRAPVPVTVPHENLAIAMAHGYYLATGRPQAVMLHVNVGTANAICGLTNAARDNVPIFVSAGRTPILEDEEKGSRSVYIHWGQEMFDQAGMLREIVKWDYELRTPKQIEQVVDRALTVSMTEPRGPTYLTLPREVLAGGDGDFSFSSPSNITTGAPAAPDADAVAQTADWLAKAERPLIVSNLFGRDPAEVPALADLCERFSVPVVSYRPRYVALPSTHPCFLGYEPGPVLPEADLIIVLDCDVPWIPKLHKLGAHTKVVHIHADPLFQRYPMRTFQTDLAVTGASASTLGALSAAMAKKVKKGDAKLKARQAWIAEKRAAYDETRTAPPPAAGGITNAHLIDAIDAARRPDDIVVAETVLPLARLTLSEPGSYFGNSGAGGLGWGLGAALGLKLGQPERRVIALVGDGSYMFGNPTPAHFVAAALGIPTLTVILNNRMWGAVRRATLSIYPDGAAAKSNRAPLTMLEPAPAYEKIVEASDGWGARVDTVDQLPGALEQALAVVEQEKRSAVLNVMIEYSDQAALADSKR